MNTKILELRDEGTFVPVMATLVEADKESRSGRLLWRSGFGPGRRYVVLTKLTTCESRSSANEWIGRTMVVAHTELEANWDLYEDGGLIDVRVIVGEASVPCRSDLR